jgi:hypothetical protein
MKATGYLQIVPERRPDGRVRSLGIARVTNRCPRSPLPGAIVIRVSIDVPEALANVQTVEAAAEAGMLTIALGSDVSDA